MDDKEIDIWADDRLGRREDAQTIHAFVDGQLMLNERRGQTRSFVLNIDMGWGGGKTFFLGLFKAYVEQQGHICVSIDAWADDHADDPFTAIVGGIRNELLAKSTAHAVKAIAAKRLPGLLMIAGKVIQPIAKGAAKQLVNKVVGEEAMNEIVQAAAGGAVDVVVDGVGAALIDQFDEKKKSVAAFRDELGALAGDVIAGGKKAPLFILIDELDRCRPDYAVALLERVKHLFSVDNVVFIIATDTTQLAHAVRGAYGATFDGDRYLKRFFDRTYKFQDASKRNFIDACFADLGLRADDFSVPFEYTIDEFLEKLFALPDIELRDIKQMMAMLETFVSVWPYDGLEIELVMLMPLICEAQFPGKDIGMRDVALQYIYNDPDNGKLRGATEHVKSFVSRFDQCKNDIFQGIRSRGLPLNDYVIKRYAKERVDLHNNNAGNGSPIPSILHEYPELLGRVARLIDIADDE